MSAFKQKMAKLGVRAGLLAGASAAVLAISGIGASSALAAPVCPNNAVKAIEGKGASLQKVAQETWTGRVVPSIKKGEELPEIPHKKLETPERGYQLACGETPSVSYSSTGSGPGLAAFGFTGTGIVENGKHEGEKHTISYIGSDDAPTTAQIGEAEKASTTKPLIIPVAETSIAVIVHPPAECTLKGNETNGLSYAELTKAFGGKEIKTWTELGAEGAGCGGEITRVVREEGSGTTFQFKNYLAALIALGGKNMPCELEGEAGKTKEWAKMKAIGTGERPNITWPEPVAGVGFCEGTTPVKRAAGGGALVKLVAETAGTIGYASLPDVKSANNVGGNAQVAWLQNSSPVVTYAQPEKPGEGVEESNCGPRVYNVPAKARTGGAEATFEGVDWSGVFGAKPTVGEKLYPLCTLTYDVAWRSYEAANYAEPEARAADVRDYLLNYVLRGGGQAIGMYYQALPGKDEAGFEPEHNVLGAAIMAAELIAK